jgi:hypothetical protein
LEWLSIAYFRVFRGTREMGVSGHAVHFGSGLDLSVAGAKDSAAGFAILVAFFSALSISANVLAPRVYAGLLSVDGKRTPMVRL